MARAASVSRGGAGGASTDEAGPIVRLGRAWQLLRRGAAAGGVGTPLVATPGSHAVLDPVQLDIIDLLATRDGQRMSELAHAVGVDPSTITRAMHRMESGGLANRRPRARHGRVVTGE